MTEESLVQQGADTLGTGAGAGWLTASEIDAIGEVGNICMSSAATALGTLLGRTVQITTPTVDAVDEADLRRHFDTPAVVVVIEYTEGLDGRNVFVLSQRDASVVADLMMGGEGLPSEELNELQASAIGEAMNQMMGSASTAMAEMAGRRVDISAPSVALIDLATDAGGLDLGLDGDLVRCSFQLRVDDLLDTAIMQLMPLGFARTLVGGLLQTAPAPAAAPAAAPASAPAARPQRWQKRAPGVRNEAQPAQRAPSSGAPQLAQNFPEAGAWQRGQGVGAVGTVGADIAAWWGHARMAC